jgi:hypothetical protein
MRAGPWACLLAAGTLAAATAAGTAGAGGAEPPAGGLDSRLQAVVDAVTSDVYVGTGLDGSGRPSTCPARRSALSVSLPGRQTRDGTRARR